MIFAKLTYYQRIELPIYFWFKTLTPRKAISHVEMSSRHTTTRSFTDKMLFVNVNLYVAALLLSVFSLTKAHDCHRNLETVWQSDVGSSPVVSSSLVADFNGDNVNNNNNNNIFISFIKYTSITPPANSKANRGRWCEDGLRLNIIVEVKKKKKYHIYNKEGQSRE